MLVNAIIDLVRDRLDDTLEPYLWSTSTLINNLNDSVDEFLDATLIVRDESTSSVCEIELAANIHTYDMDSRIQRITSARVGDSQPISILDAKDLDIGSPWWKTSDMVEDETPIGIIPDYEYGKLRITPFFDDEFYVL